MKKFRSILRWFFKLALLLVLFIALFILGSMAMTALPADTVSEPGPVSETTGLLICAGWPVII